MEGLSIAASLVALSSAGVQVSIKLFSLATQISTATERVTSLANDVSLVSGLLRQLGELEDDPSVGESSLFNAAGLDLTKHSVTVCSNAFEALRSAVYKASHQLASLQKPAKDQPKLRLRPMEKAKWPFLQPNMDNLRRDLQDAKTTLMLILQLGTLTLSKKMVNNCAPKGNDSMNMENMIRTIEAIHREQRPSIETQTDVEDCTADDTTTAPRECPNQKNNDSRATYGGFLPSGPLFDEAPDRGSLKRKMLTENAPSFIPRLQLDKSPNPKQHEAAQITTPDPTGEVFSFLLKPKLEDHSESIKLSWISQTVKLPPTNMKYIRQEETVMINTLCGFHEHEQKLVTQALQATGKVSHSAHLVSVKRTHTNLILRDTLVRDLPGVQVFINRQSKRPSTERNGAHIGGVFGVPKFSRMLLNFSSCFYCAN